MMRATLPPLARGVIRGTVRSSDGSGTYTVMLEGAAAACLCRGFKYHGHCRHVMAWQAWDQAVIPPRELPR